MNALEQISKSSMKENVPELNVGDTVKVHVRIKEGEKSRIADSFVSLDYPLFPYYSITLPIVRRTPQPTMLL